MEVNIVNSLGSKAMLKQQLWQPLGLMLLPWKLQEPWL